MSSAVVTMNATLRGAVDSSAVLIMDVKDVAKYVRPWSSS